MVKLKNVHKVIKFDQTPWLKPCIDIKKKSKKKYLINDFENDCFLEEL